MNKDLKELNLTEEQAKVIAQNHNAWRNMIHSTMSKPLAECVEAANIPNNANNRK